jgi:exo-beta-1,3-glucanase (GH17 family)
VVNAWGLKHPANTLKLALGVYEFRVGIDSCGDESTCRAWTMVQVNEAIKSANQYPDLIDRIIVGNEDLNDSNIKNRIVEDIKKIKTAINAPAIPITLQDANIGECNI